MKTLNAYFNSILYAQRAAGQLKKNRNTVVGLDIIDKYPIESDGMVNNAPDLSGSLSSLVLKGGQDVIGDKERPLLAADPMVSGMAGFHEEIADSNIKLTVRFEEDDENDVKKIIKENGGII